MESHGLGAKPHRQFPYRKKAAQFLKKFPAADEAGNRYEQVQ